MVKGYYYNDGAGTYLVKQSKEDLPESVGLDGEQLYLTSVEELPPEEPIIDTSDKDAEELGTAFDHYTLYGIIHDVNGKRMIVQESCFEMVDIESTFYVAVDKFGGFEFPVAAKNLPFYGYMPTK
jgi:hypothetical protein